MCTSIISIRAQTLAIPGTVVERAGTVGEGLPERFRGRMRGEGQDRSGSAR